MQEKEPWIVAKQLGSSQASPPAGGGDLGAGAAQKSIDNCLHLCLQLTANLAVLINPFLPTTAQKMLHMMKVVDKMLDWENAGKLKLLSVGYSLREPQLLFRKIEDEEIKEQIEKLKAGLVKTVAGSQLPDTGKPETGNLDYRNANQKFNTMTLQSWILK